MNLSKFTQKYQRLEPLWFIMVGGCAAMTHFMALLVAVHGFGLVPSWANVLAFLPAFVVSYLGHHRFTFRHSKHGHKDSLWRWFLTSLAGFLVNQGLFVTGLYLFGKSYYAIIWFVVTLLVTLMTFVLGKFWAFKKHSSQKKLKNHENIDYQH